MLNKSWREWVCILVLFLIVKEKLSAFHHWVWCQIGTFDNRTQHKMSGWFNKCVHITEIRRKANNCQGWALQGTQSTLLDLSMLSNLHFRMFLCLSNHSVFNIYTTNTHTQKPCFQGGHQLPRETIDFQKAFCLTSFILKNAIPVSSESEPAWCCLPILCKSSWSATSWRPPWRWKETHIILQTQLLYWSQPCLSTLSVCSTGVNYVNYLLNRPHPRLSPF